MIRKPTTLILGAGASKDYGFPLGKELVDQIIQKLENPESNGIYKILADLGHSDSVELGEFVTNLKGSNLDSIDEFLSKQPKYSELAKKCIAIVLIPYEKEEYLRRNGWYRFLVNRLFEGITKNQFHHNQLSIITFNYDRSLECYLKNSFRYTFGVNDSEVERCLAFIDIVHVYGQLGRLSGVGNDSRVYSPSLVPELVRRAAGQIVTVQELLGNKNKINDIAGILKKKENWVYFFGFGFSDLNLDIIRSKDYSFAQIIGTSIGFGEAQKKAISEKWKINFPGHSNSILDFIKDNAPLD
jgi:hypothetical protein